MTPMFFMWNFLKNKKGNKINTTVVVKDYRFCVENC